MGSPAGTNRIPWPACACGRFELRQHALLMCRSGGASSRCSMAESRSFGSTSFVKASTPGFLAWGIPLGTTPLCDTTEQTLNRIPHQVAIHVNQDFGVNLGDKALPHPQATLTPPRAQLVAEFEASTKRTSRATSIASRFSSPAAGRCSSCGVRSLGARRLRKCSEKSVA